MRDESVRRRYWARSAVGWPRMAEARPNAAHRALSALEARGVVRGVITQNVDRLHHRAGSRRVIELHGALDEVVCLQCAAVSPRARFQERFVASNPEPNAGRMTSAGAGAGATEGERIAPDGDADGVTAGPRTIEVPSCESCAGILMPNIVFFGGHVPRARAETAFALVEEADVLLVAGSSLTVYSGYRFVKKAAERGIPVALVNLGPTRGDPIAEVRVRMAVEQALPRLATRLARCHG